MSWQLYINEDVHYHSEYNPGLDVEEYFRKVFSCCLEPIVGSNPTMDRDRVVSALIEREMMRATAGWGIALPHARLLPAEAPRIICAVRFKVAIEWPGCIDGKQVRAAFIIVGRDGEEGPVIQMLSAVSRMVLRERNMMLYPDGFRKGVCEELIGRFGIDRSQ